MNRIARLCGMVTTFALALAGGRAMASSYAYILNDSTNTVSVIDTATNTIIAQPDIGGTSIHGSTVLPNGNFAYLGVYGANRVAVVDTVTQSVVATINGFNQPRGLTALPDSSRVYVANQSAARIHVIDTATNTVTAQVTLPVGTTGVSLAPSPDGTRVYVVLDTDNVLRYIDTATNTLNAASVSAGASPAGLAVSADGATVYIAASGNGNIRVIDTATMTQTRTITAANNPFTVALSANESTLYVPAIGGNVLRVIDTATGNSVANIPTAAQPAGVSLNPAGTRAYVTSISGNTVSIVDTTNNTVISTLSAPRPSGIGKFVTPELSRLTVSTGAGHQVTAKMSAGPVLTCSGPTACERNYATTATVTLTAQPVSASWMFTNWSGDCSGQSASITVSMATARNCTANFMNIPTTAPTPPAWFNQNVLPQHLDTIVGVDGQFTSASLAAGFQNAVNLFFAATQADGSPLPAGITFNSAGLTFTGTTQLPGLPVQSAAGGPNGIYPPALQIGSLPVMVTARDAQGSSYSISQYLDLKAPRALVAMAALSVSGAGGNAASAKPALSHDGGQVVFQSAATNLVTTAAPAGTDVLRYRALSGGLDRLSQSAFANGGPSGGALGPAIAPAVGSDGTYAAFAASGQGFVIGLNARGVRQIYRIGLKYPRVDLDPGTPTAELVSGTTTGLAGDGHSDGAALSRDGRYVAFASTATNLGTGLNGTSQVWRKDMTTGALTLVSATTAGQPMTTASADPAITADGRFVAFSSGTQVYLKDLQNGAIWAVAQGSRPRLSANGDAIVFVTGGSVVVVRGGTTTTIGAGDQPAVSADGRFVAWRDPAGQIQVSDTFRGVSALVSKTAAGVGGNGASSDPAIAGDGLSIAFATDARDLVAGNLAAGQIILAANPLVDPAGKRYWYVTSGDQQSLAIERQGNRAYVASLTYDGAGNSTWTAGFCSFSGLTCAGSGFAITFAENGTDATLTFNRTSLGLRAFPLGGSTAAAIPGLPEAGWWYNIDDPASATGWFLATATPNASGVPGAPVAMLTGAVYDAAGKPFWTAAQGTINGSTSFSFGATLNRYGGGAPLGQPTTQSPSAGPVGPIAITWTGSRTAIAILPNGQRANLARWPF